MKGIKYVRHSRSPENQNKRQKNASQTEQRIYKHPPPTGECHNIVRGLILFFLEWAHLAPTTAAAAAAAAAAASPAPPPDSPSPPLLMVLLDQKLLLPPSPPPAAPSPPPPPPMRSERSASVADWSTATPGMDLLDPL